MTDLSTILNSPLQQAERNSIDELLRRDPLSLTDTDLDMLVDFYRQLRKDVREEERTKPARAKAGAKTPKRDGANITLDDLFGAAE